MKSVFFLYTAVGSGSGLVYILRWYWWRVNAWSEIAAMSFALLQIVLFRGVIYRTEEAFNRHGLEVLIYSTIGVTLLWILVTFLTRPSSKEHLKEFYRKVRPAGPFWGPIARELEAEGEEIRPGYSPRWCLIGWASSCVLVFSLMFSTGKFLLGEPGLGFVYLVAMVVSILVLRMSFARKDAI